MAKTNAERQKAWRDRRREERDAEREAQGQLEACRKAMEVYEASPMSSYSGMFITPEAGKIIAAALSTIPKAPSGELPIAPEDLGHLSLSDVLGLLVIRGLLKVVPQNDGSEGTGRTTYQIVPTTRSGGDQ